MASRAACVLGAVGVLGALSGCSDDDGGGGQNAPLEAFSSALDTAQEVPAPIAGTSLRVTVRSLAPENGTFQSPVWIGFHDGQFDPYDLGSAANTFFPATNALERLAEDGDVDPLMQDFTASGFGTIQGLLTGVLGPAEGPIAPGETVSRIFHVDPTDPAQRYFSYASMILPSNDAFAANGDPLAHEIYDAGGSFVAVDFVVDNTAARDAGTEVNDEVPANTAFFGQSTPDTGTDENGVVTVHPGFMLAGSGGILDDPMFANADFTQVGYQFLSFSFEEVANAAPATGLATWSFNPKSRRLDFTITATGLTGPATAMHLHDGVVGVAGPVEVDLFDTITVNSDGVLAAEGQRTLTSAQATLLRAGSLYLNIHTALNPSGELRGQVEDEITGAGFAATLDTTQELPTPKLGTPIRVTARNLAPDLGTFQTPVWVGFHDGTFDIYDSGSAASTFFPVTNALERLAEDGNLDPINTAFEMLAAGPLQGVLAGIAGPLSPGETSSQVFQLDPTDSSQRYFSYASMVLPSNDAFLADGDPLAHEVFDAGGSFVGADFAVAGGAVLDAGTEVNDEIPANTAFFGQAAPDTGVIEGGVVATHTGFMAAGSGGILDDPMFANADFTALGYENLSISFQQAGTATPASGLALVALDPGLTMIDFQVFATNLSGPATMMHFHNAAAGATGPVELDIFDTIVTNEGGVLVAQGTRAVDANQLAALQAGELYINVHTALNPSGEVRGQVTAIE